MKALVALEELGYETHLDNQQIRLVWHGVGGPDRERVKPLLEELKAHKSEAIRYLKGRISFDECYRMICDAMDRIARAYVPGTIDRLQAEAPWMQIREAEREVDHACLSGNVRDLRAALGRLKALWAKARGIGE